MKPQQPLQLQDCQTVLSPYEKSQDEIIKVIKMLSHMREHLFLGDESFNQAEKQKVNENTVCFVYERCFIVKIFYRNNQQLSVSYERSKLNAQVIYL